MTELEALQRKVDRLERSYMTAIAWIAQTAGSPLGPEDARKLLAMVTGDEQQPYPDEPEPDDG